MGISRTQFIEKVRRRLGAPLVKVELCDEQIIDHIDYARQKFIKWAVGQSTQETYFTVMLQAGKKFYDMPAGVVEIVGYDDKAQRSGGINTLFTMDNYMFSNGFFGNMFQGGYDLISYHLVLDFMTTLSKYRPSKYNFKYHKLTNQLEVNPTPSFDGHYKTVTIDHPDTGIPTEYVVDSPGWVLLRSYMVEGSTLPDYKPDWWDILKEYKTIVEKHTLVQAEVDDMSFLLNYTPYDKPQAVTDDFNVASDITLIVNGNTLTKGTDWLQNDYNTRVITWINLEGGYDFQVGDVVEVAYPVVMESNYYPTDWTSVTATSTETEQFKLTQRHVDLGTLRLQYSVWNNNIKVSYDGIPLTFMTDYTVDVDGKTITILAPMYVDDVVAVTYVAVTNKRPSYEIRSQSIVRQYTTRIQTITLTPTDITNKYALLNESASVADGVILNFNGSQRIYSTDYNVTNNNRVNWNGLALDGTLVAGSKIEVMYSAATAYERELEDVFYDNDWMMDYVTAMSKITLGMIRRKFANFTSMGNQGISLDGDSLISEGKEEKADLEERLRLEESWEGLPIVMG